MVTGANEDDWHLTGVDPERDFGEFTWADLRAVAAGEPCIACGSPLEMWKGIEVGHIFKLGTKYSIAFDAYVLDEEGESHPIVMGSYGIGVERNMAAVVETHHDERGIVWPVSVAPYEVVVTVLRADEEAAAAAGEDLYRRFIEAGVEVLLDDRLERPGVKFADAELIGIPWRVTVGPRGIEAGTVEVTERATMETREVPLDEVVATVAAAVEAAR
jgi:prolyl-tRNA synthetase